VATLPPGAADWPIWWPGGAFELFSGCVMMARRSRPASGRNERLPIHPMRSFLPIAVLFLAGCAGLVTQPLSERLEAGVKNSDDPRLVAEGLPAYLILLEGGLARDPDDPGALLSTAQLYGAYLAAGTPERERARRLSAKAFAYAGRALCLHDEDLCDLPALPFDQFEARVRAAPERRVDDLYAYATAWAGFIQTHSDDWSALADLPKVEVLLERVLAIDPAYEHGMPHLYLGVIRAQRPPALGGDPEKARAHFERAIELSDGGNLMAKVEYARLYARLVFDRPLHDRLLNEVLAADPHVPDLTLINVLAQREARRLLAESAEFFEE